MVIHTPKWKSVPFQPGATVFLYEAVFLPTDASDRSQQAHVIANSTCGTLPTLSSWISHRVISINNNTTQQRIKPTLSYEKSKHESCSGDIEDVKEEEDPSCHGGDEHRQYNYTRVGILFSTDLKKESFETVICGQRRDDGTTAKKHGCIITTSNVQSVLLRLTNRTKILYKTAENDSSDEDCTVLSLRKLEQLIQFNQTLLNWKTYGRDYKELMKQKTEPWPTASASNGKQEPASHDTNLDRDENMDSSTVLFCPLLNRHSDGTKDSDMLIDWNLIKQENSRQCDCLLDMIRQKPRTTSTPLHSIDSNDKYDNNRTMLLLENRIVYHNSIRYRLVLPKKNHDSLRLTARSPFRSNHIQD
jgi:hypothetical protein